MGRANGSMPWLEPRFNKDRPKCPEKYTEIEEYIVLGAEPTISILEFIDRVKEVIEASKNKNYDLSSELRSKLREDGFTLSRVSGSKMPDKLLEIEAKYRK